MSDLIEIRRQNLANLVDLHGLAEVARRTKKPASQINDMLAGRKSFGEKVARSIERAWDEKAPAYWLDSDDSRRRKDLPTEKLLPENKGNVLAWEHPDDLPPDPNQVWIDRYDYHFCAGNGLIQWEIREKQALPFTLGFFKAIGSKPRDCKLLCVRGDSMEPYLFNRDMMMIDETKVFVRDGRIYAVYFEGEPLVKQVFKEAGGAFRLHSYNCRYPDRLVAADHLPSLQIVGEVIYRSGSGLAGNN